MPEQVAPPLASGRYQLVELLGMGGMATVYKAFDVRLDVPRAVKVLKPDLDDLARHRFFNEARTMAKLHHKNVVTVHDVAVDGDIAYLVMELIEGGSIADRMAAMGLLPEKWVADVGIAVLEGLSVAHSQGVVHRDVKPHNILVDVDGTPKVTDFGIAQASDHNTTRTGAVVGTWAYMAPEQRTDAKSVDARADVFAMGCTLYNMLTGTDPFDLYNQEVYDQLYADVPEAWHPILQKATRYKPDDRYANALEMRDAILAVVDSLPEVPDDAEPLGTPLGEERAAFVPTLYANPVTHSHGSGPTTPPRVREVRPEPIPMYIWGVLGALVIGMVFVGLLSASALLTGGMIAVNAEDAGTIVVDGPVSGPLEAYDGGGTTEVVRTETKPTVVAPVAEPRQTVTKVDKPAPTTGGFVVRIEGRPAGALVGVDGGLMKRSPWRGTLPSGVYSLQFEHADHAPANLSLTVSSRKSFCWDLARQARCR